MELPGLQRRVIGLLSGYWKALCGPDTQAMEGLPGTLQWGGRKCVLAIWRVPPRLWGHGSLKRMVLFCKTASVRLLIVVIQPSDMVADRAVASLQPLAFSLM
jgi:hypothetical protein